ncbi:TIR domain-containing protein [Xylanimonas sp. McL0601]|uniref:toll/interleukin-1 receptor domain-containing protein n=1 Tax=Xylanimonas sp. McL0601 TaxID=3414739 RepID=UPI003CF1C732
MRVFVSHSSVDGELVDIMAKRLDRSGFTVWFDHELFGGEQWWERILDEIETADVFLLALSTSSVVSRACADEHDYAVARGVPVVLVRLDDVDLSTRAYGSQHYVQYAAGDVDSHIALTAALQNAAVSPKLRPQGAAFRPPAPMSYIRDLGESVRVRALSAAEQAAAFERIATRLGDESDPVARQRLFSVLTELRDRPDVTVAVQTRIDDLVRRDGRSAPRSGPAPGTARTQQASGPGSPPKPQSNRPPTPRPSERATGPRRPGTATGTGSVPKPRPNLTPNLTPNPQANTQPSAAVSAPRVRKPAVPSVATTVWITLFFGIFGVIPAAIHSSNAHQVGRSAARYWIAFLVIFCVWVYAVGAVGYALSQGYSFSDLPLSAGLLLGGVTA